MTNDDPNVKETFVRRGRRYVIISMSMGGRKTIPYANYIWLKGNPSFVEIPIGYAIHHLDGNELNDDISNLVIMQKHHHTAYHFKQRILKPEVRLNEEPMGEKRLIYSPISEPQIKKRSGKERYYLSFTERRMGKSRTTNLYSWEGYIFRTRELAQMAKNAIWNPPNLFGVGSNERHRDIYTRFYDKSQTVTEN